MNCDSLMVLYGVWFQFHNGILQHNKQVLSSEVSITDRRYDFGTLANPEMSFLVQDDFFRVSSSINTS